MTLNTLPIEDIEGKIKLNEDAGIDIYELRRCIRKELNDFTWIGIRAGVSCQFYKEQLDYIDFKIKQLEDKEVKV